MKFWGVVFVCACATTAFCADLTVVDEIVAKVNGDIITRSELARSRKQLEADLRQQGVVGGRLTEALQESGSNLLRERIDQLLLIQKAKELNINVDNELTKILADMQARTKIADPEKFQEYVHEQSGMPFEDFKADYKNNLLTQHVIRQEVGSRINIKKEELQKYYNEHKSEFVREERVFLREIFLSTVGKDDAAVAATEKKAKDLAARARKGEKFPEMARDNSDSASAQNGGDIGPWEKGKLKKEIEDRVWNEPRGYVTDPIKTPEGFLIYKVDDHQKAGLASYEEVENEIMDKLFAPRMQPEMRKYLTKLREQAFLEIKPGYVDTGAAPGKDTSWQDPAQLKPETVSKTEVASQVRRKRLLWMIPIPGSETRETKSSSSR